MSFRWAVFAEKKGVICLFCLCMGFAALFVAKEFAVLLGKISDSILLGMFFILDRENCVDG